MKNIKNIYIIYTNVNILYNNITVDF